MRDLKTRLENVKRNLRLGIYGPTSLVLFVFLTACAGGESKFMTPKSHAIPVGATASLEVKFTAREPQEYQAEITRMLRKELPKALVTAGVFGNFSGPDGPIRYRLDVGVEKVHIVAPGARAMLGALAGKSFVRVQVDVHQAKPRRLITSFQSTGYGPSNIIDGYGYGQPVEQAIAEIVKNLK
jgi:hypothetical protein